MLYVSGFCSSFLCCTKPWCQKAFITQRRLNQSRLVQMYQRTFDMILASQTAVIVKLKKRQRCVDLLCKSIELYNKQTGIVSVSPLRPLYISYLSFLNRQLWKVFHKSCECGDTDYWPGATLGDQEPTSTGTEQELLQIKLLWYKTTKYWYKF